MNGLNDLRSYSRVWVKDFILAYKKEVCLWQTKHTDYNNTIIRNDAYDKLVKKLSEVETNPDRIMVVKKVNSLRSAFRREYRKKLSNHNYEPRLWYYDILEFIADQNSGKKMKNGRKSKAFIKYKCEEENPINISQDEILIDENEIEQHLQEVEDTDELDSNCMLEDETEMSVHIKEENNKHQIKTFKLTVEPQHHELQEAVTQIEQDDQHSPTYNEDEEMQHSQQTPASTHTVQSYHLSKEQLSAILNTSNTPPSMLSGAVSKDEFDAIGVNVASKLRCMNPTQRIIAEKLISDVLFSGQLDILSMSAKISSD